MKKARQLMDDLFESDPQAKDLRHSVEHFMRLGFDLEGAKDQVRKATTRHELKTVQRHRGFGPEETEPVERPSALNVMMALPAQPGPTHEANFHSPEERAKLAQLRTKPRRRPASRKSKLTHRI